MTDLTTAKNDCVNLQQQDHVLCTKLVSAENDQNSQLQERDSVTANRDATEKRHIMDQASDAEVAAAQQLCNTVEAKLATTNRRVELIKAARIELASKIATATQSLKIARSEFCISRRNAIFNEIQNDQKLKAKLLEALAAFALNGHIPYTTDRAKFFEMFARDFLPEFAESQVLEAAEKFRKVNGLD
ncbi:MAG: hypothetical protein HRU77_08465 [Gammaproteobacteria bacterium]|nr:MAG: hypothetical protein HRU77_08465 [Gammaproteobacteria bacterium]